MSCPLKTYNPQLVERARDMRRNMPEAERRLWFGCLLSLPVRFRRQRPFGQYVVDFYCPALKLVIEVDGESHFEERSLIYDHARTHFLQSQGVTVLRFTNEEVMRQMDGVQEAISRKVSQLSGVG